MPHDAELGTFLKRHRRALPPETPSLGDCPRVPARIGRPVTQEEVAEALGISRTWYALLESGGGGTSAALANRVAKVFDLDHAEQFELLRLTLPEFGPGLFGSDTVPNPLLWAPPFRPAETLIVASQNEIEETAHTLAVTRENFFMSGDALLPGLRKRIFNSWLRSRAAIVDSARRVAPLVVAGDAQLADLRAANERLLRAAEPVLVYIAERLSGYGFVVLLTDDHGRVLALRGDRDVRRFLERVGIAPGHDWSEEATGTNAIGTALADARPLQLMAAEHFCDGWQHLTCTAAPIHDPETLAIIGAIDITGKYQLIRADFLAQIMQYALEIEERLVPAPQLLLR
jgi:transcriptional regulator with XRE-family HTH domain